MVTKRSAISVISFKIIVYNDDVPKSGIDRSTQLGKKQTTQIYKNLPPPPKKKKSAMKCRILFKFGVLVYYWFPEASQQLKYTYRKIQNGADGPKLSIFKSL